MVGNKLVGWAPLALSLLRIVSALIFMAHGTSKLLNFPPSEMSPPAFSIFWIAGVIELLGGGLLAIGLFSRVAAFVMSGTMAAAYFIAHAPDSFFPVLNGGDAAILYCFVFLYIVFAGPGPVSVDHAMGRD